MHSVARKKTVEVTGELATSLTRTHIRGLSIGTSAMTFDDIERRFSTC